MEYSLYSNNEFVKLSKNFVCVRTHVGVPGTEEILKKYGIVGTRGRGPWVHGNNVDFVFFSPNLQPLARESLQETVPLATAESQDSIRWCYTTRADGERLSRDDTAPVVIPAMKKILERYPPKDTTTIRIPWQPSIDAAVHYASFDDRRMILASSVGGAISPKLAESLADPALLRKHVHNYVFLKLEPNQVPAELRPALEQAGFDGLVILERPDGRGKGAAPWHSATVLETARGPHTPASLSALLDKHMRQPGWEAKMTRK